jgi:hypothetical protein
MSDERVAATTVIDARGRCQLRKGQACGENPRTAAVR